MLDCESFESALDSSADLLRMSSRALRTALGDFDYNAVPADERARRSYGDLLPIYALRVRSSDLPRPKSIMWFHSTRVRPELTFHDGIRPLPLQLESIWRELGDIASEWVNPNDWKWFRSNMKGRGAQQYDIKTRSNHHAGPYAFLVRDVILNPLRENHNYCHIPEIVEDICLSYSHTYGHPLADRFRNATRPCIVKFRDSKSPPGALDAALMYLHRKIRGKDLFDQCSTCFDGSGQTIPASSIIRVEWPEKFSRALARIDGECSQKRSDGK